MFSKNGFSSTKKAVPGARAGAIFKGAEALPNRPIIHGRYRDKGRIRRGSAGSSRK